MEDLRVQLSNLIRKEFVMPNLEELINELKSGRRREKLDRKKLEKRIFDSARIVKHPLLRKVIDWGNVWGKLKEERARVAKNVEKMLKGEGDYLELLNESINLLEEIRDRAIERIVEAIRKSKMGVRPIHVPGSIASSEIPNLYFGEKYDERSLGEMSLRLIRSICIGNSVAAYLEGGTLEDLLEVIKEDILRNYGVGERHILENGLKELKISGIESSRPYIVLVKFLIWLFEKYDEERDEKMKSLLEAVIKDLKVAYGLIYFTPGGTKEDWNTMVLPRLERFISGWLEDSRRRAVIRDFAWGLYRFVGAVFERAGRLRETDKARNMLDLLFNYVDIVLKQMVETGKIVWEPLRRVVDLIVEISLRYDVPMSLHFVNHLLEETERRRGARAGLISAYLRGDISLSKLAEEMGVTREEIEEELKEKGVPIRGLGMNDVLREVKG